MKTGTIARTFEKGYGFITCEGEPNDLFFHASQLVDVAFNDLKPGDAVTFDIEPSDRPGKGNNAVNVRRA